MNITGLTYGRESKYLCERPLCSVSSHRPLLAELQPSVKSSCARLSPPVLSLSQVACRVVDTLNLFQGPSEGSPWVARPGDPNRSRNLQR